MLGVNLVPGESCNRPGRAVKGDSRSLAGFRHGVAHRGHRRPALASTSRSRGAPRRAAPTRRPPTPAPPARNHCRRQGNPATHRPRRPRGQTRYRAICLPLPCSSIVIRTRAAPTQSAADFEGPSGRNRRRATRRRCPLAQAPFDVFEPLLATRPRLVPHGDPCSATATRTTRFAAVSRHGDRRCRSRPASRASGWMRWKTPSGRAPRSADLRLAAIRRTSPGSPRPPPAPAAPATASASRGVAPAAAAATRCPTSDAAASTPISRYHSGISPSDARARPTPW